MLARQHRLRQPGDFEQARRRGRRWRGTLLTLNSAANGLEHWRAGFVVGRKVGSAVIRNRVKRRLRALVRKQSEHLPGGVDLVLIAAPASAQATFDDLDRQLQSLLAQAGLLAAGPARKQA